jgi:hypothetical protein
MLPRRFTESMDAQGTLNGSMYRAFADPELGCELSISPQFVEARGRRDHSAESADEVAALEQGKSQSASDGS